MEGRRDGLVIVLLAGVRACVIVQYCDATRPYHTAVVYARHTASIVSDRWISSPASSGTN